MLPLLSLTQGRAEASGQSGDLRGTDYGGGGGRADDFIFHINKEDDVSSVETDDRKMPEPGKSTISSPQP